MSEAKNDYSPGDKVNATDLNQIADVANDGGAFRDTLNAGETINGATLPVAVYQDTTDNELYACDANDTAKLNFIGFAISNSTDGNPISFQGNGIVSGFSGLAEGEYYYVQDDKTIGTSVGTYAILVGRAISETEIFILKEQLTGIDYYLSLSDNLKLYADTEESVSNVTYAQKKAIQIFHSGNIRVKHDMKFNSGGVTASRVYVNGVAVGTERLDGGPGSAYTTYTDDITIVEGDIVQLYAQQSGGGSGSIRNFRIYFDRLPYQDGIVLAD